MNNSLFSLEYLKLLDEDYRDILNIFSGNSNTREAKITPRNLSVYFDIEKRVMDIAKRFWKDGFVQEAYSFMEHKKELFLEKIEWAKALIKVRPLLMLEFFGDIFFLKDIDPMELALYFTHEQILQTFLSDDRTNPSSLDFNESVIFYDVIGLLESKKLINSNISMQVSTKIAPCVYNEAALQRLIDYILLMDRDAEKKLLIEILYNISNKLEIDSIEQPFQFNFKKDSATRLESYFEKYELEKAVLLLAQKHELYLLPAKKVTVDGMLKMIQENSETEELTNKLEDETIPQMMSIRLSEDGDQDTEFVLEQEDDFSPSDEDVAMATEIAETIFILAIEKGIKYLKEPIQIDFELEEVEDLVLNYSVDTLKSTLEEINRFQSVMNKKTTSIINTLDSVRKYLDGKIEETEILEWKDYAPSSVKKEIKGLSLEDAYAIVLAKSKDNTITGKSKEEIMDYRFDLEALIFGGQEDLFENPYISDEFTEYPFEEYVRHTVEAIILPHVEVLQKIEAQHGEIQFVDIWSQHFSEELKQKVRARDGFKCVICDEESNLHVHHKIPRKYGGVNHPDNLVTLCSSCHPAIETADFEHAYQKCMMNAIKAKTSFQKPVNTMKDIYLLKEEILVELDRVFVKASKRDELLGQEILQIMKKVEVVFES
ncbi:MAG: HNH endonuclease [Solibacillus sp.]